MPPHHDSYPTDPYQCPNCGDSGIDHAYEEYSMDGSGGAWEEVRCRNCDCKWVVAYKYTGIDIDRMGVKQPCPTKP